MKALDLVSYSYVLYPKIAEAPKQKTPLQSTIDALFKKKELLQSETRAFTPKRVKELKNHIIFIDALSDHVAKKYTQKYFFVAALIIWIAKKLHLGDFGALQSLRDSFQARLSKEELHLESHLVAREALELIEQVKKSREHNHYFPLKNKRIIAITPIKVVETALHYSTVDKTARLVAKITCTASAPQAAKAATWREFSFWQKLKAAKGIWPILHAIHEPITLYEELADGTFSELAHTLSREELKGHIRTLLEGLALMHEAGILHLDIKGTNILLGQKGKLVGFSDFGHAEELHSERLDQRLKGHKSYGKYGTTCYTPPELLGVQGLKANEKLDLLPFGITLYKALISKTLSWTHLIPQEIQGIDPKVQYAYAQAIQAEADRLLTYPESSLEAFIGKLLQSDPKIRPAARQALEEFKKVV